MRRIVTAISAAALAFSLVSMATPANAAAGFDSAYAGESAFLTLSPGQSGTFTVFFANTGTSSWTKGTASQVDLAACLEDKVTCNAQDAADAPYNNGWLSATRYTTQTQTTVAPGTIGTFTYNVMVPASGTGLHHFNGALVVAASGADVHNEGYFQDVNVSAPSGQAATLGGISPANIATAGGTVVTITGTGFVCTPSFPTANFGTAAGTVTACGPTTLTVTSPTCTAGTVNVTVTNAGAPASNALVVTCKDLTAPTITSITPFADTQVIKVTFSEPVCNWQALETGDFAVTVNGVAQAITEITSTLRGTRLNLGATCDPATRGSAQTGAGLLSMTSMQVKIPTTLVSGDLVAFTLKCVLAPSTTTPSGCDTDALNGTSAELQDLAGNPFADAQTVTGTAARDTTPPTVSSSVALSATAVRVSWNEAVQCGKPPLNLDNDAASGSSTTDAAFLAQFTVIAGGQSFTPTSVKCGSDTDSNNGLFGALGAQRITLTISGDLSGGGSVSYAPATDTTRNMNDISGNAAVAQTTTFTAIAAATPPIITDAHVTANVTSTNFGDTGDAFSLTFNEQMNNNTAGVAIQVVDNDPGTNKDLATFTCGTNVSCAWNTAATVLTVTVTAQTNGAGGTNPGLQLPLTITATTGLTDFDDGVAPDLSKSDTKID